MEPSAEYEHVGRVGVGPLVTLWGHRRGCNPHRGWRPSERSSEKMTSELDLDGREETRQQSGISRDPVLQRTARRFMFQKPKMFAMAGGQRIRVRSEWTIENISKVRV